MEGRWTDELYAFRFNVCKNEEWFSRLSVIYDGILIERRRANPEHWSPTGTARQAYEQLYTEMYGVQI